MSTVIIVAACALGVMAGGVRWLRVAQREHYLAGSCSLFASRWWMPTPINRALWATALAGIVISTFRPNGAYLTAGIVIVAPLGLGLKGRTSPLRFTRRANLLAAVALTFEAGLVVVGWALGDAATAAAIGALGVPIVIDAAAWVLAPVEDRLAQKFVNQARAQLARVHPQVVAITGSYGKTSTKHHITQLLSSTKSVVASPASFNNRAGLARAVNEHLAPGTEVFVAEMGTYGPGEIAALCSWCPPDIAVLTAIGPVHLERFGSIEHIVEAKAEIIERAHTVIYNADDDRLAVMVPVTAGDRAIVSVSAYNRAAGVALVTEGDDTVLMVSGEPIGPVSLAPGLQPTNVAAAVAVALALGLSPELAAKSLSQLSPASSRLVSAVGPTGIEVIDDTFNSNPAGAQAALALLAGHSAGRRVVVTPGMVELGAVQEHENALFAASVAEVADTLVVVGRTNRQALIQGAGSMTIVEARTRIKAVEWVRANLGSGDIVLYENDLPDHYP